MNLEVSIWTAYLSLEISGDTLVQLVGLVAILSGLKALIGLGRAMIES